MRIHEIMETTVAGGIAPVAMPIGKMRKRSLVNEVPQPETKRKKPNVRRRFKNSIGN